MNRFPAISILMIIIILVGISAGCLQSNTTSPSYTPPTTSLPSQISRYRVELRIGADQYFKTGKYADECGGISLKPWFMGDPYFPNSTYWTTDYTELVFAENSYSSIPLYFEIWTTKKRTIENLEKDGTKSWTTVYDRDKLLYRANDTYSIDREITIPYTKMYLDFPDVQWVTKSEYYGNRIQTFRDSHYIVHLTIYPPNSNAMEAEDSFYCWCSDYR